jgi:hypothetical protein
MPMQALFGPAGAVLSVTGTVLIEAVFAGKPALSLGAHAMASYPGVTALAAPEAIVGAVALAKNARSSEPALSLLCSLHAGSYAAEVVDPLNQADRITAEATTHLVGAFRHVLKIACKQRPIGESKEPAAHERATAVPRCRRRSQPAASKAAHHTGTRLL